MIGADVREGENSVSFTEPPDEPIIGVLGSRGRRPTRKLERLAVFGLSIRTLPDSSIPARIVRLTFSMLLLPTSMACRALKDLSLSWMCCKYGF